MTALPEALAILEVSMADKRKTPPDAKARQHGAHEAEQPQDRMDKRRQGPAVADSGRRQEPKDGQDRWASAGTTDTSEQETLDDKAVESAGQNPKPGDAGEGNKAW